MVLLAITELDYVAIVLTVLAVLILFGFFWRRGP